MIAGVKADNRDLLAGGRVVGERPISREEMASNGTLLEGPSELAPGQHRPASMNTNHLPNSHFSAASHVLPALHRPVMSSVSPEVFRGSIGPAPIAATYTSAPPVSTYASAPLVSGGSRSSLFLEDQPGYSRQYGSSAMVSGGGSRGGSVNVPSMRASSYAGGSAVMPYMGGGSISGGSMMMPYAGGGSVLMPERRIDDVIVT